MSKQETKKMLRDVQSVLEELNVSEKDQRRILKIVVSWKITKLFQCPIQKLEHAVQENPNDILLRTVLEHLYAQKECTNMSSTM